MVGSALARRLAAYAVLLAIMSMSMFRNPAMAEDRAGVPLDRDCGPYAVCIAMGLLRRGVPAFQDVRVACRVDSAGWCSMEDVGTALTDFGVRCRVGSILDVGVGEVAVALASRFGEGTNGHFVVLRRDSPERWSVFTPPLISESVEVTEIASWTEPTLLICAVGRRPIAVLTLIVVALVVMGTVGILVRFWRGGRRATSVQVASRGIVAGALLLACCSDSDSPQSFGRSTDVARSGPLELRPTSRMDLGVVSAGTHAVDFSVANASDADVSVDQVKTSCVCAGIDFDMGSPLGPGSERSGSVKLRVRAGHVERATVRIIAGPQELRLHLTARGKSAATRTSPKAEMFGAVPGVESVVEVMGDNVPGAMWSSWSASTPSGHVRIIDGSMSDRVIIGVTPRYVGPGRAMVLGWSGSDLCQVEVPWNAAYPFEVSQAPVLLRGQSEAYTLSIRSTTVAVVTSVTCNASGCEVACRESDWAVTIRSAGRAGPSRVGRVRIEWTSPEGKAFHTEIPVVEVN
ncbi:MAG: hypothetical protein HMLKMBBP_01248 [Planctomycetes bacterium]|nr:hypothetical protein [Planctomycetota bacterium]